jgi:hypothetical protein
VKQEKVRSAIKQLELSVFLRVENNEIHMTMRIKEKQLLNTESNLIPEVIP